MSQENVEIAKASFRAWSWLILWSVPAVLFAAAAYEVTMLLDLSGSYPVAYEGARATGSSTRRRQSRRLRTSPCL